MIDSIRNLRFILLYFLEYFSEWARICENFSLILLVAYFSSLSAIWDAWQQAFLLFFLIVRLPINWPSNIFIQECRCLRSFEVSLSLLRTTSLFTHLFFCVALWQYINLILALALLLLKLTLTLTFLILIGRRCTRLQHTIFFFQWVLYCRAGTLCISLLALAKVENILDKYSFRYFTLFSYGLSWWLSGVCIHLWKLSVHLAISSIEINNILISSIWYY